jgi:hypothetical protein
MTAARASAAHGALALRCHRPLVKLRFEAARDRINRTSPVSGGTSSSRLQGSPLGCSSAGGSIQTAPEEGLFVGATRSQGGGHLVGLPRFW